MMKKLFFALLTVLTLTACNNAPVFHGMTDQQKESYGKAVAGVYKGTYIIVCNDGSTNDKVYKIEDSQLTITDYTMHSVLFHDYPVSMLSKVVTDPELAKALAEAPNVDFVADYHFYEWQDNGDINWGFNMTAIPLTLHYSGADHHLLLKLRSAVYFHLTKSELDAGTPFVNQRIIQFEIEGIYEGESLVQSLDAWWTNDNDFITYFQLAE